MGAPQFNNTQNVSRETFDQLVTYHDLLLKWQNKINLISPNTVSDAWQRHFVDSMQVFDYLPQTTGHLVDLGSGAGFAGLVLAIMGVEHVTLVESDRRKCIFLKEVIRSLNLSNVDVINKRIEIVTDIKADVITARALASLDQLVEWSKPFLKNNTALVFSKGRRFEEEIAACNLPESVNIDIFDSVTDLEAKIIRLTGLFLK